ncbi:hypothetical protein D5R81_17610 [Parashewanella spongiae]|uniref:LRAT domain-containing protein n=1 Tax=Parashewanella spongiae TaxID=342950 RepID=A0A3A6TYC6_9GAMM|nr:hypothetical protein [Parashewanella spongiae]MCL1079777.1 hypothetical protein [Parashewanella spongiae]RJY06494.1 hypothetical protein D5R81_17610 [Parashewanella spongiae]
MPLPVVWIGGAIFSALLLAEKNNQRKNVELHRLRPLSKTEKKPSLKLTPSLLNKGARKAKLKNGSIVCCHVYGVILHTGIWIDGAIVELHGSGLVRVVSPERFLKDRSGEKIYVATQANGKVLFDLIAANRGKELVYQYRDYDLLKNNCYRFTYSCLSDSEEYINSFTEFNEYLIKHFQCDIYWDEALIPKKW